VTIVVLRDGIMAADTAVWNGDAINGHVRKIRRLPDGSLVGSGGSPGYAEWFSAWLVERLDATLLSFASASAPAIPEDTGFGAIWLRQDGVVWKFNHSVLPYVSVGPWDLVGAEGQDIAIGALGMGATAEQAVRVVLAHSKHAGGDVQVERLGLAPVGPRPLVRPAGNSDWMAA
jgi:hypothetical protein